MHVDPTDADRVYFGGVPLLGSADGGRTWRGLDERGVHVDHHALYIDPRAPNRLALGNDGGLNLSFDHGETWTKVNNVPVGQFTTLALDNADPYNIVGGLQDNGVMRGPSTYMPGKSDPAAWKSIYGGDGSAIAIDPKDANVIYTAYQFGNASRLNLKTGEREKIRPRHELSATKKEQPLRYNWIAPIHPLAALARHPLLRHQPPLPFVRPRRHLDRRSRRTSPPTASRATCPSAPSPRSRSRRSASASSTRAPTTARSGAAATAASPGRTCPTGSRPRAGSRA